MKEAYKKLHKVNKDGIKDTAYYRTALFQDMCSSSSVHSHPNISERREDHLFLKLTCSSSIRKVSKV